MFRANKHRSLYDIECRESGASIREWATLIITLKSPLSAATSKGVSGHKNITLARLACLCFFTAVKTKHNDSNLWRTIGAKIQLLNFACTFGIHYNLYLHLQFNIQVSNFSTPIDDLTLFVSQFNIQVYALFNIQVYAIQHSTLENIQPQSSQWQSVWAQKTIKILPV